MQIRSLEEVRERLTESQNIRLSIILSRLEAGTDQVLISPVGKRVGPEEVIDSWGRIFESNSNRMNKVLFDIEMEQKEKYGPRSIIKPWSQVRDKTISTFDSSKNECAHIEDKPPSTRDRGIIRPMSVENVIPLLKTETNSGLPFLMRTSKVIGEIMSDLELDWAEDWPTVPFVRSPDRVINGFPKSDIIQESRYFHPLFNYYRKLPCYAAMVGPSAVNTAITRMIFEANRLDLPCVSGDISRFDASFGTPLQDKCFNEMKYLINSAYHPEFDEIQRRFGNKPFLLPDGVYHGEHGIPSGSQFTNLVGSVGNRKVNQSPIEMSQYLGDDFATVTSDPESLFQRYEKCGLDLNRDKTVIANGYFLYLQNLYHPDYMEEGEIKGVYPTFRAVRSLVYPERFSDFESFDLDGKSYFAIRSLSILENCRFHPLFEEFVKWWLGYEKYAIPSNQSIANYVKYINNTTGSLGTMNQLGSDVRGLTSFKSYQLALKYS